MTDITNIPLNKLTLWTGNVRKTRNKAGIEELAASIKAHGLQQNLIVRKEGKTFAVVAGGRRLKALQLLAKAGDIKATYEIPCRVTEADNATELSLAENVMREDMHPADQFEAFRALADEGMPVADIAARFGCSEAHVQKLLKLARVSSKIIKAYRNGELTLECVMAFTVTDDHEAQEKVLAELGDGRRDAHHIRSILTENTVAVTDKRNAVPGADGLTWQDYEADIDRRVDDLHVMRRRLIGYIEIKSMGFVGDARWKKEGYYILAVYCLGVYKFRLHTIEG